MSRYYAKRRRDFAGFQRPRRLLPTLKDLADGLKRAEQAIERRRLAKTRPKTPEAK